MHTAPLPAYTNPRGLRALSGKWLIPVSPGGRSVPSCHPQNQPCCLTLLLPGLDEPRRPHEVTPALFAAPLPSASPLAFYLARALYLGRRSSSPPTPVNLVLMLSGCRHRLCPNPTSIFWPSGRPQSQRQQVKIPWDPLCSRGTAANIPTITSYGQRFSSTTTTNPITAPKGSSPDSPIPCVFPHGSRPCWTDSPTPHGTLHEPAAHSLEKTSKSNPNPPHHPHQPRPPVPTSPRLFSTPMDGVTLLSRNPHYLQAVSSPTFSLLISFTHSFPSALQLSPLQPPGASARSEGGEVAAPWVLAATAPTSCL